MGTLQRPEERTPAPQRPCPIRLSVPPVPPVNYHRPPSHSPSKHTPVCSTPRSLARSLLLLQAARLDIPIGRLVVDWPQPLTIAAGDATSRASNVVGTHVLQKDRRVALTFCSQTSPSSSSSSSSFAPLSPSSQLRLSISLSVCLCFASLKLSLRLPTKAMTAGHEPTLCNCLLPSALAIKATQLS